VGRAVSELDADQDGGGYEENHEKVLGAHRISLQPSTAAAAANAAARKNDDRNARVIVF
jgi:hypothetical protein